MKNDFESSQSNDIDTCELDNYVLDLAQAPVNATTARVSVEPEVEVVEGTDRSENCRLIAKSHRWQSGIDTQMVYYIPRIGLKRSTSSLFSGMIWR